MSDEHSVENPSFGSVEQRVEGVAEGVREGPDDDAPFYPGWGPHPAPYQQSPYQQSVGLLQPPPTEAVYAAKRARSTVLTSVGFALIALGMIAIVAAVLLARTHQESAPFPFGLYSDQVAFLGATVAALGISLAVAGSIRFTSIRADRDEEEGRALAQGVENAVGQIRDETDFLGIMRANRKQMDAYDRVARSQAEQANRAAFIAMACGLAILIAGVVVALITDADATKYAAAIITASGLGASGYVAKTFITVRESSSQQMTYYFQQPLVQSYLLAAERIAAQLPPEHKNQQLERIVEAALAKASQPGHSGLVPDL